MELDLQIDRATRDRISHLLANPYEGSEYFHINHPAARYQSNCHGTIAHALDLLSSATSHPIYLDEFGMARIIKNRFVRTDNFAIGELVAFYSGSREDLFHTSLVINPSDRVIFHQNGCAGIFGMALVEDWARAAQKSLKEEVIFRSFRKKD